MDKDYANVSDEVRADALRRYRELVVLRIAELLTDDDVVEAAEEYLASQSNDAIAEAAPNSQVDLALLLTRGEL